MTMRVPQWNIIVTLVTALAGQSQAQLVQSNASFCNWADARVNTVRDIVYLDGGRLYEEIGFEDGETTLNPVTNEGSLYYMNLSSSFNSASENLTSLFHRIPYDQATIPGTVIRSYVSGAMFANDDRLYLYGGLYPLTDSMDDAPAGEALAYEPSQDRDPGSGDFTMTDPSDVTRYVTYGAGVSSPSENLGFYISGLRAPNWGPIWDNATATKLSENMITVDMSAGQDSPVWSNLTLPPHVPPRVGAQAVWLPVSESGAIVLIGGVTVLESVYPAGLSEEDKTRSTSVSPGFMQTVSVYDIASDTWYTQNTTGEPVPPQLAQFCSVYASAPDRSSHNIYIYGGYDGLEPINEPLDNVYVLSIPAFEWTLVHSAGGRTNGRRDHTCIKPYPDQMLVLGGRALDRGPRSCVDILRVFNLNTLTFQDTYDTDTWSEYEVPDMISYIIGGNSSGGATRTSPVSWTNTSLRDVFAVEYNKTIATWYPDKDKATNNNTTATGSSSNFPPWGGGLIGGLLGLVAVVLAIGATFWLQRRRKPKGDSSLQDQTQEKKQVQSELSGKGTLSTPAELGVPGPHSTAEAGSWPVYEMNGRPEHPAELPTPHNDDSTAESRA